MSLGPSDTLTRLRLEIGGMSCASCAARIERKLNKLEGVEASVNYATGRLQWPSTRQTSVSKI